MINAIIAFYKDAKPPGLASYEYGMTSMWCMSGRENTS